MWGNQKTVLLFKIIFPCQGSLPMGSTGNVLLGCYIAEEIDFNKDASFKVWKLIGEGKVDFLSLALC